jgi:hypothetical protein
MLIKNVSYSFILQQTFIRMYFNILKNTIEINLS